MSYAVATGFLPMKFAFRVEGEVRNSVQPNILQSTNPAAAIMPM
jgi:hypothetical protein